MKKRISIIFLFLLALLITAGGLVLPSMAFFCQNRQILSDIHSYPIEQTQFYYSSGFLDTINLIANPHTSMELSQENASCSAQEAYDSALLMLDSLIKFGLLGTEQIRTHSETALFMATDPVKLPLSSYASASNSDSDLYTEVENIPLTTAVVWEVVIIFNKETAISIFIDDQSKKMVSFHLYSNDGIDYDLSSELFLSFFTDYYNIDADNEYQVITIDTITDKKYKQFFFLLSDSSNKEVLISIEVGTNSIIFNI